MTRCLFLLGLSAPLAGCGVDCGEPTQVNGIYAVFANAVTHEGTNLEEFPSYQSPANGMREWAITWDRVSDAINIDIEGQSFAAAGEWNDIECGSFTLDFGGPYQSPEGSTHQIAAVADLVVFAQSLEGTWEYDEDWTSETGESGTFSAHGQLSGEKVGKTE